MWPRSIDRATGESPLERRIRRLFPGERREEAVAFVRRYHRENGLGEAACQRRLAEVGRSVRKTGTYVHTPEELAFGARLAWRNHARCIGRLFWESLEVIDCRDVTDPDAMASHVLDHLSKAFDRGRIRSVMTVFAPAAPDQLPCTIESPQILQYAGYLDPHSGVTGDPQSIEATRVAMSLGWRPPASRGDFDILPFVIREPSGGRRLYEIPRHLAAEVPITHPDYEAIGALGLRWYAVPLISDMILTIGGIEYPCAPFNGFYMCTEIASRNFADIRRYDRLPAVARALGEDPDDPDDPLWKDRALTELNRAVIHSFAEAGVTLVDHHTASEQYMLFDRRERAAGRMPFGRWSWIVPPQASAACPVFHAPMRNGNATPNFYRSRAVDGAALGPDYSDEHRSSMRLRLDRARTRTYAWSRALAAR